MARVLLVEDDPDQREVRCMILEASGYQVSPAGDALQALQQAVGCDVVVLDMIPGATELAAALPAEMRVIVLSGREVQMGSMRADCILRKPVSSRILLEQIAQWTS